MSWRGARNIAWSTATTFASLWQEGSKENCTLNGHTVGWLDWRDRNIAASGEVLCSLATPQLMEFSSSAEEAENYRHHHQHYIQVNWPQDNNRFIAGYPSTTINNSRVPTTCIPHQPTSPPPSHAIQPSSSSLQLPQTFHGKLINFPSYRNRGQPPCSNIQQQENKTTGVTKGDSRQTVTIY